MNPRFAFILLLFPFVLALQNLPAQGFDTSANSSLHGDYFVRQVAFSRIAADGNNGRARSISGVANFDGAGGYSFKGQIMDTDSASSQPAAYTVSGTYSVGSNSLAQITNPIDNQVTMYGELGSSALTASSADGGAVDLFIAIPATPVSNGILKGSYCVGILDLSQGKSTLVRNAFFTLTASGNGSFGDVTVVGNAANLGSTAVSQTVAQATYTVSSNGSGTASFPIPNGSPVESRLIGGDKVLYVSADGNLLLGGSSKGYDILVGMKTLPAKATNASLQGLFYLAGIDIDRSGLPGNAVALSSYSGSFNANGQGKSIWHQRLHEPGALAYDYTFDSSYSLKPDGTVSESFYRYGVGAGGQVFLSIGNSDNYALNFAVRAPSVSGTGVFLDPTCVINAASFAPITNSVAPGELITLCGSGLASDTAVAQDLPFPTKLAGIRVLMNGLEAALYSVSPGQISALVPFAASDGSGYLNIQIDNNGTPSNKVTVYSNATAPGIFTLPPGGTGEGAILHTDYSVVSPGNPAHKGETVLVFLTGLGKVDPAVPDGAPGPTDPFSTAVADIQVYIDDHAASVSYKGLAPELGGLYQLNVQVPQEAGPGDVYFDISSSGAYHSQARIAVAP